MPALHPAHALWRRLPARQRRRWLAVAMAAVAPRPDPNPPAPAHGIAVGGEVTRASGLGEGARLMHRALALAGVDSVLVDVGDPVPTRRKQAMAPLPELPRGMPLILHVNAPFLPWALRRLGRAAIKGRRIVGFWAWELPIAPTGWATALPFVHEIWAPSSFTAAALRGLLPPGSPIQIRAVPLPVAIGRLTPSALDRAAFGLPDAAVVVVVSFNLASSFVRKNPIAAIAAFRKAFGDRVDRVLVLKVGNPDHGAAEMNEIVAAIDGARNIRIETRTLPAPDNLALTACADIVLSLHRSEGFGLVPAEAMLLGRPVVATGWSGNMDFMDETTAALVDYRLIPAHDARGIYEVDGAMWAEPDVEDAAQHLVRLAGDRATRLALGGRGQAMARARLGPAPLLDAVQDLGLQMPWEPHSAER